MSQYVDGFVIPVPRENIEIYSQLAAEAGAIWMDHGALAYRECIGEDLEVERASPPQPGELVVAAHRPFARTVSASLDETVVFAWIVYESREERDRINAAVMEDPRMKAIIARGEPPFDTSRMAFGGFTTLVNL